MHPIIQQDMDSIISTPLPWERFAGKKVLITGASGMLPAYMVDTLIYLNKHVLDKPAKVYAFCHNTQRALDRFSDYTERDLEIWVGDVSVPLNTEMKFDYIIHAASHASPTAYKADPIGTLLANTRGTEHLLNAAVGGKGFLYFSSSEVHLPLDTLDLRSCYGESKRMGEMMCTAWWYQAQVPAKIVRISHTYGPGMRLADGRVFADFVQDILKGGPIVMHSDGSAVRPFLYLADATKAFFTVLLNGENGAAYNVANPSQTISVRELANKLADIYQLKVDIAYNEKQDSASPNKTQLIIADIDKLESLGWKPTTTIEEGFKRTVESYQ